MRKLPAGYYALGVSINPDSVVGRRNDSPKAWSSNGFVLFSAADARSFRVIAERPTRVDTVHAWGMCRLVDVRVGVIQFTPTDGALFVHVGKVMYFGDCLDVTIEAVCVEEQKQEQDECGAEVKPRTCNRHVDCDAADARAKILEGRDSAEHCSDEFCEDCFGR